MITRLAGYSDPFVVVTLDFFLSGPNGGIFEGLALEAGVELGGSQTVGRATRKHPDLHRRQTLPQIRGPVLL